MIKYEIYSYNDMSIYMAFFVLYFIVVIHSHLTNATMEQGLVYLVYQSSLHYIHPPIRFIHCTYQNANKSQRSI